jgi:peptide/nickel transport system permease protein
MSGVALARAPASSRRRTRGAGLLLGTGLAIVLALAVIALLATVIAPHPEDAGSATHPAQILLPPSSSHPFGTDQVGRDLLSRVLVGSRVSLGIAVSVLVASLAIGVPLGLVAGYFGGWVDSVLMRVTDVMLAFPALLLALALVAVLGPSVRNAALCIALTWWPWYARLARGQARAIVERPFIESAHVLGLGHRRTMLRHVTPNSLTPVIVQASADSAGIILTAAALSFLGLGAQDPTPEWGLLVSQGQSLYATAWWVMTFPGLAILVASLGFTLIGDGLRDRLDPHRTAVR